VSWSLLGALAPVGSEDASISRRSRVPSASINRVKKSTISFNTTKKIKAIRILVPLLLDIDIFY
jgi:hypothetical protein